MHLGEGAKHLADGALVFFFNDKYLSAKKIPYGRQRFRNCGVIFLPLSGAPVPAAMASATAVMWVPTIIRKYHAVSTPKQQQQQALSSKRGSLYGSLLYC